ncbi:MAG: GMC family oxidoreductase N-terminal domain-containing protein, partial [Pseudomonadota bacterium]
MNRQVTKTAQLTGASLGTFDYVIVGAGSAGCTLANRLTANPAVRVCLLEAGGADKNPMIHAPVGFAFMGDKARENWSFDTVPQRHLNNRTGYQPRGRVLGGSSSINAMIYIRGFQSDYDNWAALGAEGWGYADVLPYFIRTENNERGEDAYHGTGGPLNVADLRSKNPLCEAFLEAARQLQMPMVEDFNGPALATPTGEGFGFYQVTQKDGKRCSAAKAYLEPVRTRQNLCVITHAHAEKILFEDGAAKGIQFRRGRETQTVFADGEVILSAGAFQSPHLLQLSGIGPGAHLRDQHIDVRVDNPAVGNHLQDHLDYCLLRTSASPDAVGLTWPMVKRALPSLLAYRRGGPAAP